MVYYTCIAKCPEFDVDNLQHCKATFEETRFYTPTDVDFCPYGNKPVWEIIIDSEELK